MTLDRTRKRVSYKVTPTNGRLVPGQDLSSGQGAFIYAMSRQLRRWPEEKGATLPLNAPINLPRTNSARSIKVARPIGFGSRRRAKSNFARYISVLFLVTSLVDTQNNDKNNCNFTRALFALKSSSETLYQALCVGELAESELAGRLNEACVCLCFARLPRERERERKEFCRQI